MITGFQNQSVLLKDLTLGTVCISELDYDDNVSNPTKYIFKENRGHKTIVLQVNPETTGLKEIELLSTLRVCPKVDSNTVSQEQTINNHLITYGAHIYGYQIRVDYDFGGYNLFSFGNNGRENHYRKRPNGDTSSIEDMHNWAREYAEYLASVHNVPKENIMHDSSIDNAIRISGNQKYKLEY